TLALVSLFDIALVHSAIAQISQGTRDDANRLIGSIYAGPSMTTLRELSDGFGGRLSGSPAYNRSAGWAAAKVRSYGIQNVKLEPFSMPSGWQRVSSRGEFVAPVARPLHVESVGWTPSTPAGGVKGEVVFLDDVSPDNIKKNAAKFKNKIVLFDMSKIFADGWQKVLVDAMKAPERLKDAGAIAFATTDSAKNNVINAGSLDWGGNLSALPGAEIGMEDSEYIRRLLEKGPVTIWFETKNTTSGTMQVNNVVAEIRGSQQP